MFKKVFNIIFNKNIMAPPISWRTSSVGSSFRRLWESFLDMVKPNQVGKNFRNVMLSNPTKEAAQEACELFAKETGIQLFVTSPVDSYCFAEFANILLRDIKKGRFPKDIKHVIFGHGSGTSLVKSGKDVWHVAADPKVGIFDFVEQHVPKGNNVLVNCCEETPKSLRHLIPKDKPAIGRATYTDATSSYYHPLKIVESGKRQIVGAYANGIATMYH